MLPSPALLSTPPSAPSPSQLALSPCLPGLQLQPSSLSEPSSPLQVVSLPAPSLSSTDHPSQFTTAPVSSPTLLRSSSVHSQNNVPVHEERIGPARNKKGRKEKAKSGTKRGASSIHRQPNPSPLSEHQNLCKVGKGIILTLATLAQETLLTAGAGGSVEAASNFTSVEGLLVRLMHGPTHLQFPNHNDPHHTWITLGWMAQKCHDSDAQDSSTHLTYWINVMQFTSQVLR